MGRIRGSKECELEECVKQRRLMSDSRVGGFVFSITRYSGSFLRNALYFTVIAAIQRCEQFHRYSQKLLSRSKAKKQIIVAVMILLAAFAILKYDCKFDPNLIFKTH